ncbi:unnamed protein product, partial [Sphagnum compactum]
MEAERALAHTRTEEAVVAAVKQYQEFASASNSHIAIDNRDMIEIVRSLEEQLKQTIDSFAQQKQYIVDSVASQYASQEGQVRQLQERIRTCRTRSIHCGATNTELVAACAMKEEQMEQLSVELKTSERSVRECEERCKSLEQLVWQTKAENAELISSVEYNSKVTEKYKIAEEIRENELTSLRSELTAVRRSQNENDALLASYLTEISSYQNENSSSNAPSSKDLNEAVHQIKCEEIESELRSLNSKYEETTSQLLVLQSRYQNLLSENDVLKKISGDSSNSQEELQAKIRELVEENQSMYQQLTQNSMEDSLNVAQLTKDLRASQDRARALEVHLEALRSDCSRLEKDLYEKQKEITTTRADMSLLQQENDQKNTECMNLKTALDQLTKARDQDKHSCKLQYLQLLQQKEAEMEQKLLEKEKSLELELQKLNEIKLTLEQNLSDEALLRRKAELDMNTEKRKMQKTLETALQQLQNSREDVVDRTLIANLIVSYFKRNRSQDVLELITKILGFTDDQKEAVGLTVLKGPAAIITSIFTAVVGKPAPPANLE